MAGNRAQKSGFAAEAQAKGYQDENLNFVSQQYRAWSDCTDVQAGLALYWWQRRLITFGVGRMMNAKYDEDFASQAMCWINERISEVGESPVNTSGNSNDVHATLRDGYILCALMKAIDPSSVKAYKRQTMAFKQMENIGNFLNAIEKYGVAKHDSFQTVDLYEGVNLTQVVMTIHALGRKVNSKGGKGIGPKESKPQSREWTDEQLKAGQNVIGLQMGTNKGASQAGQSFGKPRHIVD